MKINFFNSLIVAVLCYCGISSVALADWQYTMWGMTLDEVISASNGVAKKFTDNGKDTENTKLLAVTPYTAGEFVFQAGFNFDRKTETLTIVRLELKKGNGHSLYAALVSRYGIPVSESEDLVYSSARWLDRDNNNSVAWLMIGSDYTAVQYSALIGESEKAL